MENLTLDELQTAIGEWSLSNFGGQESKAYPDLVLGSLAPLLGIFEEYGEWKEAETMEDWVDALGDVLVYLCDYATREGFRLKDHWPTKELLEDLDVGKEVHLRIALGKLAHCTLKRHQGIRGFLDPVKYHEARGAAVGKILACVVNIAWDRNVDPMVVLNTVWSKVVAKRNWKAKPEDAHKVEG